MITTSDTCFSSRYGSNPISLTEAICIKSALIQQNPEKLYFHTDIVSLSIYGQYWKALVNGCNIYKVFDIFSHQVSDTSLQLSKKLRVFMAKETQELNIFGKQGVNAKSASIYWKFHVLYKHGGLVLDTNILLLQSVDTLRWGISRFVTVLKFI